jgi:phosphodiesterase/alkaline phosphatase D-like protein
MKRREFIVSSAAVIAGAVISAGAWAASGVHVAYTPAAFAKAKASGEPVLLDFYASW